MNDFFHKSIQELSEAFENALFAYYKSKSGSFNAIVVKGIGLYENDRFVDEQEKIIEEFYSFYPNEDISFISFSEVSVFPRLECVIDFQETLYDWFSNFQFADSRYGNDFQNNQDTSIECTNFALAA
ncbi:MAG: hypothetical protein Q8R90_03805 [Bacteroidales bacterium]|nr:hypothetical protein [Bacteroidales bacterium]